MVPSWGRVENNNKKVAVVSKKVAVVSCQLSGVSKRVAVARYQ